MELNTYNLTVEEIDLLTIIGKKLIHDYGFELTNDKLAEFENVFRGFDFIKTYETVEFLNVFKLKNDFQNLHLVNIKIGYNYIGIKGGRHYGNDFCLYGYFETRRELGHVLIRPETIGDKVTELFSKTEIDFESNPKFSKKYYLLSDNKELTKNNIDTSLLSVIEEEDEIFIEINNNKAIATFLKTISIEETKKIAGFCKKVSKVA